MKNSLLHLFALSLRGICSWLFILCMFKVWWRISRLTCLIQKSIFGWWLQKSIFGWWLISFESFPHNLSYIPIGVACIACVTCRMSWLYRLVSDILNLLWTHLLVALVSVSFICLFYLPLLCHLGNVKYQHSPLYTRYVCPLLWSYRVSPGPGCEPDSSSVRIVFTMMYQLSSTLGSSLARCSIHGSNIYSSLARRAFLHQPILFSFVSPLPAGSFSINLDYHLLIMMDNNVLVCGRVLRTTFNFLSLLPCRI